MSTSPLGHTDPIPEPADFYTVEANKRLCLLLQIAANSLQRAHDQARQASTMAESCEYTRNQICRAQLQLDQARQILIDHAARFELDVSPASGIAVEPPPADAGPKGGA